MEENLKAQRWNERIGANDPVNWAVKAVENTVIQSVIVFTVAMLLLYVVRPPFIGASSQDPLDIEEPYLWKTVFWAAVCVVIFVLLKRFADF